MGGGPLRSIEERFWEKVDVRPDGCWIWTATQVAGYGWFCVGTRSGGGGKGCRAHRWSYELLKGPIPDGLEIDHLCRVRLCVNPDHLEAVTSSVNNWRRKAVVTSCKRGHPLPESYVQRSNGDRTCRVCLLEADRRYRARSRVKGAYDSARNV